MWISIILLLGAQTASAEPKNARDAEAIRLYDEIQRLSQRTAWSGVERTYTKLAEMKRVEVPPYAHLLGARAAQNTGDIRSARERAQRAVSNANGDMETLTEASMFLTEFEINHGPVRITAPAKFDPPPAITAMSHSFDPNVRAALDHANATLTADRVFQGFLPLGQYRVGSTSFDILPANVATQVIALPLQPGMAMPPPVPAPVPVAVESRMVFLSVRGEGWAADRWQPVQTELTAALRANPGVLLVDSFFPEQSWIVVRFERAALDDAKFTEETVAAVLSENWVRNDNKTTLGFVLAPPHDLAARAVGARLIERTALKDLASISVEETGPYPVQSDTSARANYRIEVKVQGLTDADLEKMIATVGGAEELGFTLEEPGAN